MGRASFTITRRGLQSLYYGTHQIVYLAILITTCFSLLSSNLKSTSQSNFKVSFMLV